MAIKREISEEEAWKIYDSVYERNRAQFRRYGKMFGDETLAEEGEYDYLRLRRNKLTPERVLPSARAYGRLRYKKALEKYNEQLEAWTADSGLPKPRKPHRDSLERYVRQMANSNTRRYSEAQASNIARQGTFEIEVPVLNRKTGEIKIDKSTGEVITRRRKVTKNDIYFLPETAINKFVWGPIRLRKQELIKEQKDLGDAGKKGEDLWRYYSDVIAKEFFGSDPKSQNRY